jgi:bifunctional UDP-N-acetylglucosamine pyrophosphorylase / glucosamine-1-phosphate N-acetyltransferase
LKLAVIILAAGLGKRMYSDTPKVLHPLADKPLIAHVVDTAWQLAPAHVHIVHGFGGEQVRNTLNDKRLLWTEQAQQLGTGHAVQQVIPHIADDNMVLVLYGDVPLIQADTLQALCAKVTQNSMAILTVNLPNPTGYGRIIRNSLGQVFKITEEKDADAQTKQIREVNTGIVAVPAVQLRRWLNLLNNNNAQGEYYLTDIVSYAAQEGITIHTHAPHDEYEVRGVNDRIQLAELERYYQLQQAHRLMQQGVAVRDPARLDIRGKVTVGRDVALDINVILEGQVTLGNRVKIGANVIIQNSQIGDDTEIYPNSMLQNSIVGTHCKIGPFARLRPDNQLTNHVHIGNFVELKKSSVGEGSKINHLSYIGDSDIGAGVNIGAGTITCNYDGVNKHKTIIGDHAFIGSDTQLIAPVTVGENATIGAGSTITQDAPAHSLTLSRAKQVTIAGWARPTKQNTTPQSSTKQSPNK